MRLEKHHRDGIKSLLQNIKVESPVSNLGSLSIAATWGSLADRLDAAIAYHLAVPLSDQETYDEWLEAIEQFRKIAKYEPDYSRWTTAWAYAAEYHARKVYDALCFMPDFFSEFVNDEPLRIVDVGSGTGAIEHAFRFFSLAVAASDWLQMPAIHWTNVDRASAMLQTCHAVRTFVFPDGGRYLGAKRLVTPPPMTVEDREFDWRDLSSADWLSRCDDSTILVGSNFLAPGDHAQAQTLLELLQRHKPRGCAFWVFGSDEKFLQIRKVAMSLRELGWREITIDPWDCGLRGELKQVTGMYKRGLPTVRESSSHWGGQVIDAGTARAVFVRPA